MTCLIGGLIVTGVLVGLLVIAVVVLVTASEGGQ